MSDSAPAPVPMPPARPTDAAGDDAAATKGRSSSSDLVKAALLLDSLSAGVVQGLREILAIREKGEARYLDLPDYVAGLDPAILTDALKDAAPAEIAAVFRVLPPDKAAEFLGRLDPATLEKAVPAAAAMDTFQALRALRGVERRLLVARARREMAGGTDALAAALSRADDRVVARAIEALGKADQAAAQWVRARVFTAEDVTRIPDREVAAVLFGLDEAGIGRALVGAPEALRRKVLANLGKGRREVVEKEAEFARKMAPADLGRARRAFLDALATASPRGEGRD